MYFILYSTTPGNILGRSSSGVLEATELVQLGCGVDDEHGGYARQTSVVIKKKGQTIVTCHALTYHSDSFTDSAAILMSCIHILLMQERRT
jgi:hypothetical protein